MNTPNPLVPQGSFADKGKHHIRITVFAILAVHVVLLGVLLIAGCNKKDPNTAGTDPGGLPAQPPSPGPDAQWPPIPTPPPTAGVAVANSTGLPPAGLPPTSLVPVAPTGSVVSPVPGPGPTVDPLPIPSATVHTVVKGDSFSTLGKQYKVGYQAIARVNPGVDSTKLKIGQKVNIPPPKAPAGATSSGAGGAALAPVSDGGAEKNYTVKSQDNLTKIAKINGTSIKALRAANNLRTDQLKVGQKLKIPSKTPPPVEATASVPALPPATPGIPETAPPGFIPVTNR